MEQKKYANFTEYVLTNYRGILSTIFLLPVSVAIDVYKYLRNRIVFMLKSAPKKHDKRVKRIMNDLEKWRNDSAKEKLCTSRHPYQSVSELVSDYKRTYRLINVALFDILNVDEKRQVVRVEPMVNMGQISATLLPLGWTLAVTPELNDLTVAGLIMGFGIETSSHKYGLFQHICESFEVITPDGQLRKCSKTENSDLFYMLPWSYGTLGFLVAAELKIIPAKKFVRLHYRPVHSFEELVRVFEQESRNTEKNEFVEALTFSADEAVVMTGSFADKPEKDGRVNRIGLWYKSWFYTHVYKFMQGEGVEYIPTRHYYHRHTRSLFWEMGEVIPFGNHPLFRFLLGWAMPPQLGLMKRMQTSAIEELRTRHHMVQDMLVPIKFMLKSLEYFEDEMKLHPLWLCPMRVYENERKIGFLHPYKENGKIDDLFVDIGAYGTPQSPKFKGDPSLKRLEQFVIDHHGYQAMYARSLMSREQYETMFDHKDYYRLRKSLPYVEEAYEDVYSKIILGRKPPSKSKI